MTGGKLKVIFMRVGERFGNVTNWLNRDFREMVWAGLKTFVLMVASFVFIRGIVVWIGNDSVAKEYETVKAACKWVGLEVTVKEQRLHSSAPLRVYFVCERE